ncbi:MAG: glutathione S-transferase family protein [Burkholderiaceae bacterium]
MTAGPTARLHYFAGRGRAETTRWMLAATGIPFENLPLETPGALAALRSSGKLPFDQIPLLEIDGLCLSQSSALIRFLARRGNLYGDTPVEAMWCDMVAGAAADFAETAMQAAFMATREEALLALALRVSKFGPRFEDRLRSNETGYVAGERLSFADVVLAQATHSYREIEVSLLSDYPLLSKHCELITKRPEISSYLKSALCYPPPDDTYVISTARTLQRALPAHMPDKDRFVV